MLSQEERISRLLHGFSLGFRLFVFVAMFIGF
jgi:hypothetical protein